MRPSNGYTQDQVERAARIYADDQSAARALGLSSGTTFKRICTRHGVEAPSERNRREAHRRG